MRHFIFSLALFSLSTLTSGQKGDTMRIYLNEELEYTSKNEAAYGAMAIRSGNIWYLLAVYPDTTILLEAYFKDKKLTQKEGPFVLYYPKGVKAMQGHYVNNIQQGIWKFYYRNGQLKDSGQLKNNQMVNTWYSWHENGTLLSIGNYPDDQSIPEKSVIIKFSFSKGVFMNDTIVNAKNGLWRSYYDNGQPKDSGLYKQTAKDGSWISWHKNGNIDSRGQYNLDLQVGKWEYFHENGQPSTIEIYKNNKIVEMECFDETGKTEGSFCSILKPPVPILDRFTDFNQYMLDHLFWPKELEGKNVNGQVKINYTISKEGVLTSFQVLETPHELLGKEVERFFRSIEKWSPAISHNRKIDFPVYLEIPFYR